MKRLTKSQREQINQHLSDYVLYHNRALAQGSSKAMINELDNCLKVRENLYLLIETIIENVNIESLDK